MDYLEKTLDAAKRLDNILQAPEWGLASFHLTIRSLLTQIRDNAAMALGEANMKEKQ